jgi:hypothetical protein
VQFGGDGNCYSTSQKIAGYTSNSSKRTDTATYGSNVLDSGNTLSIISGTNLTGRINDSLVAGNAVIVGVNRNGGIKGKNNNTTTEHFVVINGSGEQDGVPYYTFLDPGASTSERGANPMNRLYQMEDGSLSGYTQYKTGSGVQFYYTVSEFRINE